MPKWFVYCTLAMLTFAVWTLVIRPAMKDLSPYAMTVVDPSGTYDSASPDVKTDLECQRDKEASYMMQALSAIGLIPFAIPLLFSKKIRHGSNFPRGIVFALCCGAFSATGNLLLYQAVAAKGPLSLVCPITAMPLIPVILAPYLFKERISLAQAVGVGCALVAITLLNTDPTSRIAGAKLISPWMLFALLSLLSYGVAMTTQKAATYHVSDEFSTVVYTVAFIAVGAALFVIDPNLITMFKLVPWRHTLWSLSIGLCMGYGTLMLYAAYRHGKAAIVSPYVLMYPVITVLVAVPVYHEPIDLLRGIGMMFALAACVLLGIEKSQPAAVAAPVDSV